MGCDIRVYRSPEDLARQAADVVVRQLRGKPDSVLALPTGRTPRLMYRELVRRHQRGEVSFARAAVFALDEYYGLRAGDARTFRAYLERHLADQVDLDPARLHVPRTDAPAPLAEADAYERAIARAGGIDLAVVGVGSNGHIAFNEPGSPFESRTRLVDLTPETVAEQVETFGDRQAVPRQAITIGVAMVLSARRVVLLATGAGKADVIRAALLGPATTDLPVSALRQHPDFLVLLDEAAAARFLADRRRQAERSA